MNLIFFWIAIPLAIIAILQFTGAVGSVRRVHFVVRSNLLEVGSQSGDVRALQTALNELGFYVGTADGIFGEMTEAGVKKFQEAHDLTVDGKAGLETFGQLNVELRKIGGSFTYAGV